MRLERFLPDAEATRAVGRALGRAALGGDVLAAAGTLGAGKTCLAQGLAEGLGVAADHYVNSPTFAILQVHPGRLPFNHVDLYRLGDADEALSLGLEERIGVEGVSLIEWPGRALELLPADCLWLRLTAQGSGRLMECVAEGPRAQRWLAAARLG